MWLVTDEDSRPTRQTRIAVQRGRILTSLATVISVDDEAQIAVTGWLAFAQTAILEWLDNPTTTREQLRDLYARTLYAAVGLHPEANR